MNAAVVGSGRAARHAIDLSPALDAVRGLGARHIATGLAASLLFALWRGYFLVDEHARGHPLLPKLPGLLLCGIALVLAVTVADAYARRGARPLAAYGAAVLVSAVASAVAAWYLTRALGGQSWFDPEEPLAVQRTQMLFASIMQIVHSGFVVAIYLQWREREAISRRLRASALRRADDDRRLQQARLRALQARLDPEFLFAALERVGELSDESSERADRLLDDTIALLRLLTPSRVATSDRVGATVESELEIAAAYLRVRDGCDGATRALRARMPADAAAAPLPPMLLLPLLRTIACRGGTCVRVDIGAAVASGALTLSFRRDGDDEAIVDDTELAALRRLLIEHCGTDGARADIEPPATLRVQLPLAHERR
jgi:hypothetical protein